MVVGFGVEHVLFGSVQMNFGSTTEQSDLRREARRFLSANAASARVRATMQSEAGYDVDAWRRAASELGWTSLIVPEAYGGAGLGWPELAALAEENGRALACVPFFSTVCLATNALLESPSSPYLQRISSGEITASLAFAEQANIEPFSIATTASADGDGIVLSGTKRYVVDGATADLLLVTARTPGSSGDDGVGTYAVEANAKGVERTRVPTLDMTRPQATVVLRDVRVSREAEIGDGAALRRTLDRASIALAAECLGGADRCLEMATEYAKTRVQFERPIGSFQAIRHKLADMLVFVETARSAVLYAASVASATDDAALAIAASVAKSYASDAFFQVAAETIQIHGGIGFTWEHDAHLYFRRARASLTMLGSVARDRERIARVIGLATAAMGSAS
jgi:alkylation response protein AidB-like acyl-CoA dehydrogenase